jgi:hypothetical protein
MRIFFMYLVFHSCLVLLLIVEFFQLIYFNHLSFQLVFSFNLVACILCISYGKIALFKFMLFEVNLHGLKCLRKKGEST